MKLGVDADGLEALGATLARCGTSIDRLRVELSAAARAARWTGADADRFRRQWHTQFEPAAARAVSGLASASIDARRQAAQQRIASAPGPPAVALSLGATGGDRAASAIAAAPRRVRLIDIDLEGGTQVVGGVHLALRVEDLGDGRSRIVERSRVEAAAGPNPSSRIGVSMGRRSISFGADGTAAVEAMAGTGASWIMPTAEVDAFLAHQAMERATAGASNAVGGRIASLPAAGLVAGMLGWGSAYAAATYAPPPLERVEAAVGIGGQLSGNATASRRAGDLAASLRLDDVGGVVVDQRAGTVTLRLGSLLVAGAAASGPGSGSGFARGVDGSMTTSLVLDAGLRPVQLLHERTEIDGDRMIRTRSALDLTDPSVRAEAAAFVDALRHSAGSGSADVSARFDELLGVGVSKMAHSTDTYRSGEPRTYGVEVPVGSASVTSRELVLER